MADQADGSCRVGLGRAHAFEQHHVGMLQQRQQGCPRDQPGLVRGHPFAIGLVTWGNDELEGAAAGCSNPFHLVRLDYYRDWILSHVRQMQ